MINNTCLILEKKLLISKIEKYIKKHERNPDKNLTACLPTQIENLNACRSNEELAKEIQNIKDILENIDAHFFELAYNAGKTSAEGLNNAFNNLEQDKINNLYIKVRVAEINRSIDNLEWQLEQLKQKRADLYFINLFDKLVVEKFKNGDYSDEEFDEWAEVINGAINEEPTAMGEIQAEVEKWLKK